MKDQDTTPIEDAENLDAEATEPEAPEAELDGAEPEDSEVKSEDLLAEAERKAEAYLASWQRERADFTNYKKRAERDLLTMRFNAKVDTLKALLPILDDFERAIENQPENLDAGAWLDGIAAIHRKLAKTLEDEGIMPIDPVGEAFDPNLHEAIGQDSDSDVESGHVTVTLQKGYVCGDRILRPALVRVAE